MGRIELKKKNQSGSKSTKLDCNVMNGPKWNEMEKSWLYGLKWTECDWSGLNWTENDHSRQKCYIDVANRSLTIINVILQLLDITYIIPVWCMAWWRFICKPNIL